MSTKLLQTQIAFFLKKNFGAFESLSLEVKKKLGKEGNSQYLPVPDDAPIEFPRLTIIYKEQRIVAFKNRIDIFFNGDHDVDILQKIIDIILNIMGLPIERLGFVKTFFSELGISELKSLISKKEVSENPDLKEISVNINIVKNVNGFGCNNLEKISLGSVTGGKNGVIILKDCNTMAGNSLSDLDTEKMLSLITEMSKENTRFFLLLS